MCFVADGYCTVYEEKTIKQSRKPHKCSDCYKVIPTGSSYKQVFSVFEGDANTAKMCQLCLSLRAGIVEVELAEGCSANEAEPLLGMLFDQLHDSDPAHYYHRLIELGRAKDATWLASNCKFDLEGEEYQ